MAMTEFAFSQLLLLRRSLPVHKNCIGGPFPKAELRKYHLPGTFSYKPASLEMKPRSGRICKKFDLCLTSHFLSQRYFFAWLRQRNNETFDAFHLRVKDVANACDFRSEFDRRVRDQIGE